MEGRQRTVLLGLAALVVVAAIVIAVTSGGGDDSSGVPTTSAGRVPTVVVAHGKPVGGVQTLRFRKGGTIAFAVRSDRAGEIHFHGYDIARDVTAGGTVRFDVPAKVDGKFEVEVEDTRTQIASVEVLP